MTPAEMYAIPRPSWHIAVMPAVDFDVTLQVIAEGIQPSRMLAAQAPHELRKHVGDEVFSSEGEGGGEVDAAGADAVMTAHIELPALDSGAFAPSSLSEKVIGDLLRGHRGQDAA